MKILRAMDFHEVEAAPLGGRCRLLEVLDKSRDICA
jgi:hypothetical protein